MAARTLPFPPSYDQLTLATKLVRDHGIVEVPGKWNRAGEPSLDPISIPEPRSLRDYCTTPCRHEYSLLKQARHAKQAHAILWGMDTLKQALMRASSGQCWMDSAHSSGAIVEAVAKMDCPASLSHDELIEGVLFCASTLYLFALPYGFANLANRVLPEVFPCCSAPVWDLDQHPSRVDRIFTWQCHMGKCGGDGRRLHAHEVVQLAMKKVVLSCSTPGGCAFPAVLVLIEPRHLRHDNSRPEGLYVVGMGMHMMDVVMVVVITSGLHRSCLSHSSTSSDFVICDAENKKFGTDANSTVPIQISAP